MTLPTAQNTFIRNLKVRHKTEAKHGQVVMVRLDSNDRTKSIIKVELNSGAVMDFDADEIIPNELVFRCEYCRKQKPQSEQTKIFGIARPRCCRACRPTGERMIIAATQRRNSNGG